MGAIRQGSIPATRLTTIGTALLAFCGLAVADGVAPASARAGGPTAAPRPTAAAGQGVAPSPTAATGQGVATSPAVAAGQGDADDGAHHANGDDSRQHGEGRWGLDISEGGTIIATMSALRSIEFGGSPGASGIAASTSLPIFYNGTKTTGTSDANSAVASRATQAPASLLQFVLASKATGLNMVAGMAVRMDSVDVANLTSSLTQTLDDGSASSLLSVDFLADHQGNLLVRLTRADDAQDMQSPTRVMLTFGIQAASQAGRDDDRSREDDGERFGSNGVTETILVTIIPAPQEVLPMNDAAYRAKVSTASPTSGALAPVTSGTTTLATQ